jgi:bacillithiol synthase
LMERYGLSVPAFLHGEDGLRERIAHKLVPPDLTEKFDQVRRTLEQSVDSLRDDLTGFDASLAAAAKKSSAKMLYQLSKIEGKTGRETLKRNERAGADASYMSGLIFPDKHLQERYYSILPFLAKHGVSDLMNRLYEHLRLECPDHQVLVV